MSAVEHRTAPGVEGLVAAIVQDSHDLVGIDAACNGSHELFEPPVPYELADDLAYRRTAALRLCHACPALDACHRWLDTQPRTRWAGWIVAGQHIEEVR